MIRPDSPMVLDTVEALRAFGAQALRTRRLALARSFYVLAARWTRYAFDAAGLDEAGEIVCTAALVRESERLVGRFA